MKVLSKGIYSEWCKIHRFLETESYEKIFALIFFIFKNSSSFQFSLKNFSLFKNFFEFFRKVGNFSFPTFFFLGIEGLNFKHREETDPSPQILVLLFGVGIWDLFQKNWNLENIQFFLFCWKKLIKHSQIFLFETKSFSLVGNFSQTLFSNCPKVDIKNFQQQVFFLFKLTKSNGKFFLKNLNFLREISYKFLKSLWCIEMGRYSVKIFVRFFNDWENHPKPFQFFRTSLLQAMNILKERTVQFKHKKNNRFFEKLIWINKKKKDLKLNKKVKIRKIF